MPVPVSAISIATRSAAIARVANALVDVADVAVDKVNRVVNFLGDPGDKVAEARHFFAVDELKLSGLQFVDALGNAIDHRRQGRGNIAEFVIARL